MKTRAALLFSQPGKWEVTDVELDEPKAHEVLVRIMAAGLCHSDDHLATGDVLSGVPSCGRCRWCSQGLQNLCDNGAMMLMGTQIDGTFRMHVNGDDVAQA